MTWTAPPIWDGGECWVIGGGPSIPKQFGVPEEVIKAVLSKELPLGAYSPYMQAIHDKHVIGVNMAFQIGDWIDMIFFGDKKWYFQNRQALAVFPGLKVTCHPYFANDKFRKEYIKHVGRDRNHPRGISPDPRRASWNANSGAAAISVAANMGVKRIILLGFDMKLGEGFRQHWHSEYSISGRGDVDAKKLPFRRHLLGFVEIAKDAKKRGIEIINASPDSKITELRKISVKEILNEHNGQE